MVLDQFMLTDRSPSSPARAGASAPRSPAPSPTAGADVVLASRTKEQLDEVADDVRGAGRRAAGRARAT